MKTTLENDTPATQDAKQPLIVVESVFQPLREQAINWLTQVKDLSEGSTEPTKEEMERIKEARRSLQAIRVNGEHKRVEHKEYFLRGGQMVDGAFRELKKMIEPVEAKLMERENYHERKRQEAIQSLRVERAKMLAEYLPSSTMVNQYGDLGVKTDEEWKALLIGCQVAFKTRQEEEERVRQERLAQEKTMAEEQERLRAENARLEADRAKRQRELAAEQRKREEAEALLRKEIEEREERERIEKQRAADERKAARKAAAAPDQDKIVAFADQIIKGPFPKMSTPDGEKLLDWTKEKLIEIRNKVVAHAEKMGDAE